MQNQVKSSKPKQFYKHFPRIYRTALVLRTYNSLEYVSFDADVLFKQYVALIVLQLNPPGKVF